MVMAARRWYGSGGEVVTVVEVMMWCRGCGGGWWVWRGGVDGGCHGVWWPEHGRTAPEFGPKKRGGGGWWLGSEVKKSSRTRKVKGYNSHLKFRKFPVVTTNAKDVDTRNSDEEITDTAKADAEKTKELKDDIKKAELSPSSFSLSVSSCFDNQFLNLSSDKSTVGTFKDSVDADINSLLDVQTNKRYHRCNPLSAISQRVSVLEKDVQQLKASRRCTSKGAIDHTAKLIQQYPQQVKYKDVIKDSVQANVINKVKNLLPKFLPKVVSDFATLVIQSTVNKALEKTPKALA
ncbi:hypothetical protein Tco_1392376 [Tanacetum coccineum]